MKITKLEIIQWRGFTDIVIDVPRDATLVALIGENGVGKSSILDIVNSAAHRLGLSAGVDIPRGDPFQETHRIRVDVDLGLDVQKLLPSSIIDTWNSSGIPFSSGLTLDSDNFSGGKVVLTAAPAHLDSHFFAQHIVDSLRIAAETFHLSLDADRAYPPRAVNAHEYVQSLDNDWESTGQRKHRAFISSRGKYEEWMKYLVGTEAKKATEFAQATRAAKLKGEPNPDFDDQFASYATSVKTVLPHLQFSGVDTRNKTILFDSMGEAITFDKLSGGEREIAFVIGQIERFGLRSGILLIDEPELHLNPEMVRTWIAYLRDTVQRGQTWIATHSMEAVEAAGLECSFVVQRDIKTRRVADVTSLADQPALSLLSAAVGSPAFSLTTRKFVFIEGDRSGVERDKFFRLTKLFSQHRGYRFMEGGGCSEIARKVEACKMMMDSPGELHIGGIIDRDHRSQIEIGELTSKGLFALPFHEIENAFIYPSAVETLRIRAGLAESATDLIRRLGDKRCGQWIFGRAVHRSAIKLKNHREISSFWANLSFPDISNQEIETFCHVLPEGTQESVAHYNHELKAALNTYREIRDSEDFWMHVEGKQVLSLLSSELGFGKQIIYLNNICSVYEEDRSKAPLLLNDVVKYIEDI